MRTIYYHGRQLASGSRTIYYLVNLHAGTLVRPFGRISVARRAAANLSSASGCTFVVAEGVEWFQGEKACEHMKPRAARPPKGRIAIVSPSSCRRKPR